MVRKPEATSIPPDTGAIDSDWADAQGGGEYDGSGPTAVPPEPYEEYARRASQGSMTDEETRRALSTPAMPLIDQAELEALFAEDKGRAREADPTIPLIGQHSGSYEIPLELGENGEEVHPSERPTTPLLEPPPISQGIPTPRVQAPDELATWGAEAPTPAAASPETMEALRKASTPGRAVLRAGPALEGPEISVGVSDIDAFDLDEPGGIGMEDSLEISIGQIPPAPFDLPPPPLEVDARPKPREPKRRDSLELSLDGDGDALDLVSARATPVVPDPSDPLIDLRDRYAVGDFTGAHEIAESILAQDPGNAEALRFRESCRDVLTQMYTARLGSTAKIPRLAIPAAELQWLSLDHRAGFLLSCVDGRSTIEEILDVSGMPALDALRILYTLLQQQIIEMTG